MHNYQAPNDLLSDKIILVTGASDGIGKEAAISYARLGATVVLLGRSQEKLEDVYDLIESAGGPQPAIVPLNLESAVEQDYKQLADTIEQEFGRLDGLLLNASILGDITPIESYPVEQWARVMQINVNSQFAITKALLPLLKQSNAGSIIFTTSSVGRKGRAHWGAYGVSKFATEGLMQTLTDELENTCAVRVNCINPGATRTAMRANAYPAEDPATVCHPKDIMGLYHFLMGNESLDTKGQSLDAQPK
ncbi:YciK family oxidoreductase [Gammaproteobacteria bacterium 45_16_T64]|nr:YciK family oxidoreductase [Gammaproteobacteria bacterium 45_16_T64]